MALMIKHISLNIYITRDSPARKLICVHVIDTVSKDNFTGNPALNVF